ncbi:MAG: hypothetical protein GVY28_13990 [Alphaproteobacteria bacterium]|jgi:hypothetical protein|nr:hypothetical protein [Alphaproteobacteria bacterium]
MPDDVKKPVLEEATTGRRRFLAGAAAGSTAAVAATIGAMPTAEAKIGNVDTTPVTDTLTDSEAEMLTERAAGLTEQEIILHNWSLEGYGDSPVPDLTDEDVESLERAFISRNRRLWGLGDQASLAPNMVNSAHASTSCCCCPASCCCASVDAKPVRTRRVIA